MIESTESTRKRRRAEVFMSKLTILVIGVVEVWIIVLVLAL